MEGMTVYTAISKKIGIQGPSMLLPNKDVAAALLERVLKADQQAYEAVFRYYRFAKGPINKDEEVALNIICDAYRKGREIFQNVTA